MKLLFALLAVGAYAQDAGHFFVEIPEYQQMFSQGDLEQYQAETNLSENFLNMKNAQDAIRKQTESALNTATDDRVNLHSDLDQLVGHHAAVSAAERAVITTNLDTNRINDIETAAKAQAARNALDAGIRLNFDQDAVMADTAAHSRGVIAEDLAFADAKITAFIQENEDLDIAEREIINNALDAGFKLSNEERTRIANSAAEGRATNKATLVAQGLHDSSSRQTIEDSVIAAMDAAEDSRQEMETRLSDDDDAMMALLDALKEVDQEHAAQFEATEQRLREHQALHESIQAQHDTLVDNMNTAMQSAADDRDRVETEAKAANSQNASDLLEMQEANNRAFKEAEADRLATAQHAASELADHAAYAKQQLDASVSAINEEMAEAKRQRDDMRSEYQAELKAHHERLNKIRTDIDAAKAAVEAEFLAAAQAREESHRALDGAIKALDFKTAKDLEAQVKSVDDQFKAAYEHREAIRVEAAESLATQMEAALANANAKFEAARLERVRIESEQGADLGDLDAAMFARFEAESMRVNEAFDQAKSARNQIREEARQAREEAATAMAEDMAVLIQGVELKLWQAEQDRNAVRSEIDAGLETLAADQAAALQDLANDTEAAFNDATAERADIQAQVDANFAQQEKALEDYKTQAAEIMQEEVRAIENKFQDASDARDAIQRSIDNANEEQKAALAAAMADADSRFRATKTERDEIKAEAEANYADIERTIQHERDAFDAAMQRTHEDWTANMEAVDEGFDVMTEDFTSQITSNKAKADAAMGVFKTDLSNLTESTSEAFVEHTAELNAAEAAAKKSFEDAQQERDDLAQEAMDALSQSKTEEAANLLAAEGRANEKFDQASIDLKMVEDQIDDNVEVVQDNLDRAVDDAADALEQAQAVTNLKLEQAEEHRLQLAAEAEAALNDHKDDTAAAFTAAADQAEKDKDAAEADRNAMKIAHNQLANTVAQDREAFIARLDSQMAEANQRFEDAKQARDDLQANIDANGDAIAALDAESKARLAAAQAEFNRKFDEAAADRDAVRAEAAQALEEGLAEAKEAADKAFAEAQRDRERIEGEMADARANDDTNRQAILDAELARIENEFAAATAARATIQAAHDELVSGLTADSERIAKETLRINNKIAELENQIRQHEENHADIPDIQTEITSLTRELASLAGSAGSFLTEGGE